MLQVIQTTISLLTLSLHTGRNFHENIFYLAYYSNYFQLFHPSRIVNRSYDPQALTWKRHDLWHIVINICDYVLVLSSYFGLMFYTYVYRVLSSSGDSKNSFSGSAS